MYVYCLSSTSYLSPFFYLAVSLYISISFSRSLYLYFDLFLYLSPTYLPIYLSIREQLCETSFKHEKLTNTIENEASLQGVLKNSTLTTSKTQQFCETSSNIRSCQHQKRGNSARLPLKIKRGEKTRWLNWRIFAPMYFAIFPSHVPKVCGVLTF